MNSLNKETIETTTTESDNELTLRECLHIASKDVASVLALKNILSDCSDNVPPKDAGALSIAFDKCLYTSISKDITGAVMLKDMIIDHLSLISENVTYEFPQDKSAVNEYTVVENYTLLDIDSQTRKKDALISETSLYANTVGDDSLQDLPGNEILNFSSGAFLMMGTPNDKQNSCQNDQINTFMTTKKNAETVSLSTPKEYLNMVADIKHCTFVDLKENKPNALCQPPKLNTNETKRGREDNVGTDSSTIRKCDISCAVQGTCPKYNTADCIDISKHKASHCFNNFWKDISAPISVKNDAINNSHKMLPQNTKKTKYGNKLAVITNQKETTVPYDTVKIKKESTAECSIISSNETIVPEVMKKKKKSVAECPIRSRETTVPELVTINNAVAKCLKNEPKDSTVREPVKIKKKAIAECPIITQIDTTVPVPVHKMAITDCINIKPRKIIVPKRLNIKKKAEYPNIGSKNTIVPEPTYKKLSVGECASVKSKATTVSIKKEAADECVNNERYEPTVSMPVKTKKNKKEVTECFNIEPKLIAELESVKKEAVTECLNMTSHIDATPIASVVENLDVKTSISIYSTYRTEVTRSGSKTMHLKVYTDSENLPQDKDMQDMQNMNSVTLSYPYIMPKNTSTISDTLKENECTNLTNIEVQEIKNDIAIICIEYDNGTTAKDSGDLAPILKKDVKIVNIGRISVYNIKSHNLTLHNYDFLNLEIHITTDDKDVSQENFSSLLDNAPSVNPSSLPKDPITVPVSLVATWTSVNSQATDVREAKNNEVAIKYNIQNHTGSPEEPVKYGDTDITFYCPSLYSSKIVNLKIHIITEGYGIPPQPTLIMVTDFPNIQPTVAYNVNDTAAHEQKNTARNAERKSKTKEIARKRKSKWNTDNSVPNDTCSMVAQDDDFLKLVKMKTQTENERRHEMLNWIEKKFLNNAALLQLQERLSKKAPDQPKKYLATNQPKLANENTKANSVSTKCTLIKGSKSLSSTIEKTRNESILTSATCVKCVESIETVPSKQDLLPTLATAIVPYAKYNKDSVNKSGGKAGSKDPYECIPFDEYSLQGVKGKKGPIYRGPPSSLMTKRKYLTSDKDNEKPDRTSVTSHQKAQKTGKAKNSMIEAECGGTSLNNDYKLTFRTCKDGTGFIPDMASFCKHKYYNFQKGARASNKRYTNQCYLASMKATEKAQKENAVAESDSRK